jgi:hypothetical protein
MGVRHSGRVGDKAMILYAAVFMLGFTAGGALITAIIRQWVMDKWDA